VRFRPIHIVFDGPPGPDGPRFVEIERPDGRSVRAGTWHQREDGLWEIRPYEAHPDDRKTPR
jgi:hypothetical protein